MSMSWIDRCRLATMLLIPREGEKRSLGSSGAREVSISGHDHMLVETKRIPEGIPSIGFMMTILST